MSDPHTSRGERDDLLQVVATVGREHSDATVLFHSAVAERLGLNATDEKTLSILHRLGPLSAIDLASQTGLAPSSVTNLIDRLETRGFVRRHPDPRDRRRITIELVADRIAETERLFASTRESLATLIERYSDQELQIITDFLGRNAERLRVETGNLSARGPRRLEKR